MAYTKQTWTDDVSAVTGARMTHIEQGIYDNSLASDKINPSGTATTTAEIEEGQINDVIGFKSLKLKGQTSQGENPTPDSPQDVNNVSGYNVVGISNVNKLPYAKSGSYAVSGMTHTSNGKGTYTLNGTATANSRYDWEIEPYTIKQGDYLYLGNTATNSTVTVALLENASTQIMYTGPTQVNRIVSLNNYVGRKVTYIRTYTNAQTLNNFILKPMICTTTSVSSFVEHQGNDFEINLSTNVVYSPRIWQNTSTVATQANRLFSTPQKLVKAGTYKLATTLDFTTYKYALEVGTTPYPFASNLHDSGWKTTNNFSHTIPKGFVGIIVTRLDNANITADEMKGVKFELRDTTLDDYDIELCKIGTYQDYIYKKDGKWFVHKEFEKLALKDLNWFLADNTGISNTNTHRWGCSHPCARITNNNMQVTMSNILPMGSANITWGRDVLSIGQSVSQVVIRMPVEYTTAEAMKTALAETNAVGYALLGTPIEEEITYTPLIRQLDELYNSGLYDVTNISQNNSSEAFILDIEACKNNINGIVEYIRR